MKEGITRLIAPNGKKYYNESAGLDKSCKEDAKMKRYSLIALAVLMAAGMMMGCSSNSQANEEHEKALTELRTELEEVQAELATTQAELEAAQAENARLLEQIIVVDTPAAPQAEQSTQGAADKTQTQAPTSSEAIQQEVQQQKEQEAAKTLPPKTSSSQPSSSANDLLNDVLGGGSGGTSKPSGGSSSQSGMWGNPEGAGGDGSGLLTEGEDTTNW